MTTVVPSWCRCLRRAPADCSCRYFGACLTGSRISSPRRSPMPRRRWPNPAYCGSMSFADAIDPGHVVLVEVYRDADAASAHKQTQHYATWRDTVAEMMAGPAPRRRFAPVLPTDEARTGEPVGDLPVSPFDFGTAGRVIFGAGPRSGTRPLINGWGSRALVCTGSRPDGHAALLRQHAVALRGRDGAGRADSRDGRSAASAGRAQGADVVVAIGGGSVLDLGKAVAMLLGNGGDPLDYLEVIGAGQQITHRRFRSSRYRRPLEPVRRSPRTRCWPPPSTAGKPASAAR